MTSIDNMNEIQPQGGVNLDEANETPEPPDVAEGAETKVKFNESDRKVLEKALFVLVTKRPLREEGGMNRNANKEENEKRDGEYRIDNARRTLTQEQINIGRQALIDHFKNGKNDKKNSFMNGERADARIVTMWQKICDSKEVAKTAPAGGIKRFRKAKQDEEQARAIEKEEKKLAALQTGVSVFFKPAFNLIVKCELCMERDRDEEFSEKQLERRSAYFQRLDYYCYENRCYGNGVPKNARRKNFRLVRYEI